MPGIQHVHALELDNCDISLRAAEMFVYANCTLYYLYNFTYQSAAHDSMYKKDISTNMMSYFGLENIVINVK